MSNQIEIPAGQDHRPVRGLEIAAHCRIKQSGDGWFVPSQTGSGSHYVVLGDQPHCSCPDFEARGKRCKHIYAVEFTVQRETVGSGSDTVTTETVTVKATKKTYGQNWSKYNAAQTSEKTKFQSLLHELCKDIEDAPQTKGRPRLRLADAVFSVTFKIFSTVSARRFISDLCDAQAKGHIGKVPHFNSIFNYLENPALTPILMSLIEKSSLPLRSVETDFAVDSTGFMTSRFTRWYDQKYGAPRQQHDWVKAHIACGVKTNIITAVEIRDQHQNDSPILPALVDSTAKNFSVREVSADKGYTSAMNMEAIAKHGATSYIPFKSTSKAGNGELWDKMFHYFNYKREEFLSHYHKRSNIESTMMMVKSKFGDAVRSKTDVAMRNEVLCKILCHNICCLISAVHELGIDPLAF